MKFVNNRSNRNRPLSIGGFVPEKKDEYMILQIAKAIHEDEVTFLKSILDRYGYKIIKDSWEEMMGVVKSDRKIYSLKRFLNHIIQERLKTGEYPKLKREKRFSLRRF